MPQQRTLKQPLTFYAGDLESDLLARADTPDRAGASRVAQRDLERYYYHARLALYSLRDLSVKQFMLVMDAMNGTITEPHTASLLWANVADSLPDGLAEKWGVDGPALAERLRRLSPFEALALSDACERFWNRVAAGIRESDEDRLVAVGLVAP